MVSLARRRLQGIPGATVHLTSGADLAMFAADYFDFVYSYIVFQHIPDREVVLNYLREGQRVLKDGGVLCCQIRGTAPLSSELSRESETWTGCFFSESEIAEFARQQSFPLVAISGLNTQYMWTTFRKATGRAEYSSNRTMVKDVISASGIERRIPDRGRRAAVSLWLNGMPNDASLADLSVSFGNAQKYGCYLSPVSESGGCQLNVRLPDGVKPGVCKVQLRAGTELLGVAHSITVYAQPLDKPRVVSVTDGINITSVNRLETGGAKVTIENVPDPAGFSFTIAGFAAEYLQYECIDPITSTYVFGFRLKEHIPGGRSRLIVKELGQELDSLNVEVAP
jgi:hypothetical protein